MNRRIDKKGGTLLVLLVILTMMLSGCGSFFGEEDILVETEEQVNPEILLDVAEMEFGHMMIYQFQVQEVKGLTGAERFVLLRTDEAEGIVAEMTEPLYAMDLMGEVTLAVLTEENRVLARTVIPTGTYQKTFALYLSKEEVNVRDTSIVLEEQSLVGTYLADGVLPYTGEEGDIEQNIVLRMAGDGETDLDYNYFVINDIAIEFNYAFNEPSRFNVLFSEKFSEVDYVFDDLDLYIHHNNTMIDAKTGNEVTDIQEIELSIVKIYNANHRNGRQRATANVVYSARQDVGQITVFTVNVTEVNGIRRATGFTILEPQESFTNFGTEITRSTDSNQIFFYILGGDTDDFAGGNGTAQFPYLISNADQLYNMRYYMDAGTYFQLTADIDLRDLGEDSISPQQEGAWTPIGSYSNPFQGHFDGKGYIISNLEIERPDRVDVGLFGYIGDSGEIEGLFLENVTVEGQRQVGALVGRNRGSIRDCEVKDGSVIGLEFVGGLAGVNYEGGHIINSTTRDISVTGDAEGNRSGNFVGGLVGANSSDAIIDDSIARGPVSGVDNVGGLAGSNDTFAEIRGSSATGAVTGSGENVGGLVGLNSGSDIERSHATGEVNGGGLYVGGLVGLNEDRSRIDLSYATGSVTGAHNTVGGLVGMNWDGDIEESYATGHVRGVTNIGGLVGVNWERGSIEESYATGNVSGSGNRIGGLVGRNDHIIDGSYYAGGTVYGLDNVGLFIGVNWYDGEITGSHASGQSTGLFVGDNRNDSFELIQYNINDYFSTDSAAVTEDGGGTQLVLDKAPAAAVTIYLAPAWTPVGDLRDGDDGETIEELEGNGKDIRIDVPITTRNDYKVILVDSNRNKIESSATLKVQNVNDVLYYDSEWNVPDDVDYRSARIGHRFTLDLGPVEGVTAWIAPEGTIRHLLRESNDNMTKLEGSRSLRRNIDAPDEVSTDYKLFLIDAYNNYVESDNWIVIGDIGNEDTGDYFVSLEHAIGAEETRTGHTIRLYSDYELGSRQDPNDDYGYDNILVNPPTEIPSLTIDKSVTIDLNRNTLKFGSESKLEITANNTVIENGRIDDKADIDVDANNVEINEVQFEDEITITDLTEDNKVTFEDVIFTDHVTVTPGAAGTAEFYNISLGRNVELDGGRVTVSAITSPITIENNRVKIENITFEGHITVDGNNAEFKGVNFDDNIEVYGNNQLTVKNDNDNEVGNNVAFFDVKFELDQEVVGDNVYMLRVEFSGANGTLTIDGKDFYAESAIFKDDVTITGTAITGAVFNNADFEGVTIQNKDKAVFNTTFRDDITIGADTYFDGVKLRKNNLELTITQNATLFLTDDMDIDNNTIYIQEGGTFDGRRNKITGGRDAKVIFKDGITLNNVRSDVDVEMEGDFAGTLEDIEITLTENVTATSITLRNGVVIDLDGKTLGVSGDAIEVVGNAKIKSSSGTGNISEPGIHVKSGGRLTLEGEISITTTALTLTGIIVTRDAKLVHDLTPTHAGIEKPDDSITDSGINNKSTSAIVFYWKPPNEPRQDWLNNLDTVSVSQTGISITAINNYTITDERITIGQDQGVTSGNLQLIIKSKNYEAVTTNAIEID